MSETKCKTLFRNTAKRVFARLTLVFNQAGRYVDFIYQFIQINPRCIPPPHFRLNRTVQDVIFQMLFISLLTRKSVRGSSSGWERTSFAKRKPRLPCTPSSTVACPSVWNKRRRVRRSNKRNSIGEGKFWKNHTAHLFVIFFSLTHTYKFQENSPPNHNLPSVP